MINREPTYAYFLALMIGLIIVFIPDIGPLPLSLGLMFSLSGMLLGAMWPRKSWRWGLWLTGPMLALMGLSLAFSGNLEIFVEKDLLPTLISFFAACGGSFAGAWIRMKYRNAKSF